MMDMLNFYITRQYIFFNMLADLLLLLCDSNKYNSN